MSEWPSVLLLARYSTAVKPDARPRGGRSLTTERAAPTSALPAPRRTVRPCGSLSEVRLMSPTRRLLIVIALAGLTRRQERRRARVALRHGSHRVRREAALRLARLGRGISRAGRGVGSA
jgi:hypothetical protein